MNETSLVYYAMQDDLIFSVCEKNTLKSHNSNKSYRAVLSSGNVYYGTQDDCYFHWWWSLIV